MAAYRATTEWTLAEGEDFLKGRYSRGHALAYGSGLSAPGTASPHVVGDRWAAEGALDPEEAMVGAISACHMLSFLHVAREAGVVVTSYRDAAEGRMAKNEAGQLWLAHVTLRPEIRYAGAEPTAEDLARLHHAAHETCYIANSVRTEIVVEDA